MSDEAWLASIRRDRGTARQRVAELTGLALASRVSTDTLCLRLPAELADDFLGAVEAARQAVDPARLFSTSDSCRGAVGSDGTSESAGRSCDPARLFSTRGRPTPSWVGLLCLLDEFVTTWDPPGSVGSGRRSSEERIYSRDGWRCAAPGCTSRRHLEDHHLRYRSRGGGNEPENRLCLCRFHHQWGEHGRLARCRGRAPLGVRWSLGRDGLGGRFLNERVLGPAPASAVGAL